MNKNERNGIVNTIEYKRISYTTICIDEHSHFFINE